MLIDDLEYPIQPVRL